MTIGEWITFKLHAVRALYRMARHLSNWRAVWSSYRARRPLPPLHFRSGLILHHGEHDSPINVLHEIFGERQYAQHINFPLRGTMIDLGANIGAVSMDCALRSVNLRVHAYEPNPATNQVLRQNVDANGLSERVTVHNEAVGRERGELTIWTNMHSMMVTAYSDAPPQLGATAMSVPLIDLNEVVRRAGGGPVELLKIDTEGGEADTLEGATTSTLATISQVILEYHDTLCPDALARCRRVLEGAGFHCSVRPFNEGIGLLYARRNGITL